MAIYSQYRWRWRRQKVKGADKWEGLREDDTWQIGSKLIDGGLAPYDQRRKREVDFWFGRG